MPIELFDLTGKSREDWLDLRKHDVTASDVPAMLGADDYKSPLRLWHEKARLIDLPEQAETGPMRRGRRHERTVAEIVAELRPDWRIEKANVYLRDTDIRLGCTPDYFIHDDPRGLGVLQIKTCTPSVFEREWCGPPEDKAPFRATLQCLTERLLTGAAFGVLAAYAIDPWDDPPPAIREVMPHPKAEQRICAFTVKFWDDIAHRREPEPDYGMDRELLAMLAPHEVPDSTVDLSGDNEALSGVVERAELKDRIKNDLARCEEIEAMMMHKIGDAERVIGIPDFRITWKTQHRKELHRAGKGPSRAAHPRPPARQR